ncbi:MAG: glycosyltransferase [Terracidiphilus sp.]|jgi:glycosyltransferase involved in cell wall biosynthesis
MSLLRVLLVVYAFPPAGGVGTLRAASLARYLPAEGIRLDVLTTRNPASVGTDVSLLQDIPSEVTIHRTVTLDIPFGIKKRIKRLITGEESPGSRALGTHQASKPSFMKRVLQDLLLPDPQVTWLPVLTRAARRIVRERETQLVMITGAPFSAFLLIERLRREFPQLAIVADFRDEWLISQFEYGSFQFSSSERARSFAASAEARAVANATAVVTVNKATLDVMRERYPKEPPDKFHLIPNGYDATRVHRSPSSGVPRRDGKILITHTGTLYAATDPTWFIEALQSLPPDVKSRIKLRFIGHIDEPRYCDALLQLGEMVELVGYMPQRDALTAMSETDFVLMIGHDRLNIQGKFYDYVGAGKPILACLHPAGDIRRLLEEMRAGWWADGRDVESIRRLIVDAADRGHSLLNAFRPDTEKIARYERKVLAHRYARLLHSVARGQVERSIDRLAADRVEKVAK